MRLCLPLLLAALIAASYLGCATVTEKRTITAVYENPETGERWTEEKEIGGDVEFSAPDINEIIIGVFGSGTIYH